MAYPRRRAPTRRKRPARRGLRRVRTRPVRSIASKTHLIKRLAEPILVQNNVDIASPVLSQDGSGMFSLAGVAGDSLPGTVQFGMSATFMLKSAVEYTDLTQLFDRYKITGVKLTYQFLNNAVDIGSHNLPTIYYSWDGDDASTPVVASTVLTKGYCKTKVLNANRIFKSYCKPRVDKVVYSSGLTNAYTSEKACWIDCTNASVEHYGMKFWVTNWSSTSPNIALRIQPTFYLAMRDTQ